MREKLIQQVKDLLNKVIRGEVEPDPEYYSLNKETDKCIVPTLKFLNGKIILRHRGYRNVWFGLEVSIYKEDKELFKDTLNEKEVDLLFLTAHNKLTKKTVDKKFDEICSVFSEIYRK